MDTLASLSFEALLSITLIVFLGGLIKGFLGFGMPLFATPLLALFMPLLSVIPMMAVPVLASNIYQAKFSRKSLEYLKRFWPLGLGQIIGVSLGVQVLVHADSNVLKICLGIIVLINIALRTTKWKLKIPPNKEGVSGPVGGLAAGVVGGTTSFVGPLLVLYLSSLENFKKDDFVKAIGRIDDLYQSALASQISIVNQVRAQDAFCKHVASPHRAFQAPCVKIADHDFVDPG